MKFNTLICLFDEHNEVNILLAEKFKVKNLVFICTECDREIVEGLSRTYSNMIPDCSIKFESLKRGNILQIRDILNTYKDEIINLTGGDRLTSLILLKVASELGKESIYVDLINKRRYILTEEFRVGREELKDMTIRDIIDFSGISIICESSDLINKQEILEIIKIIKDNIDLWHKYKQKLYDNKAFIHDYKDTYKVIISKMNLEKEEMDLVNSSIKYLKEINGIDYYEKQDEILVKFKNDYLKGFLFKSGTWLEVLTHLAINEIDEVDEVKSGVTFSWSNKAQEVRNELDVVAVKDSVLVCISCKDSEKYDEDALNELKVYSDKIGGEDTIKILVATKKPAKGTVSSRAREMGINLVILNKDIEEFKETIRGIINKS